MESLGHVPARPVTRADDMKDQVILIIGQQSSRRGIPLETRHDGGQVIVHHLAGSSEMGPLFSVPDRQQYL